MNHVNMRLLIADVPYTEHLPQQLVSSLVWNGQRGVQIFFAISGFLITTTTLRRWSSLSNTSVRGFYLMRLARIAPLLFLLLAVLSALHLAHLHNLSSRKKPVDSRAPSSLHSPSTSTSSKLIAATFLATGTFSGRSPLKKCSTCSSLLLLAF